LTPELRIAATQLARMRGMNAAYHRRFFVDIQFSVVVIVALTIAGFGGIEEVFLLVPFVALLGAAQTAFDASYLIFSRHYATALEHRINRELGSEVLVANRLEEDYLFPLNKKKVVTLAPGGGFTWFGFMTGFYTLLGIAAFVVAIALGWDVLTDAGGAVTALYLAVLGILGAVTLATGWWWFVGGEGERRLEAILSDYGD
jgi:hypothetical protein